jgi:molybdopterin/thiamine biosynthesis adenylyltransferase/rhodanese-related sulfurtransferase
VRVPTFKELLKQVRGGVREVSVEEARSLAEAGAALVDVRETDEWQQGHVPGALHVPRGLLELRIEEKVPDRERVVVLYCAGGTRSALAVRSLAEMGYSGAVSLAGGFSRWREQGGAVTVPRVLSPAQRERYSRHLRVPEVGEAGQARLLDSKALLVGAGGLGCPAGLYLAAAGVGTIGVADFDRVDLSNLQRQVLHTSDRVGAPKTESAEAALRALNPDVTVVRHDVRLEAANVLDVIAPYDVIVDGCDNFATKYLVNDAAVLRKKTVVYGSIFRFDGQASVFAPGGPCYRCLYPEATPAELAPSCDEAGVLGVLPGVVGLIQATEALKVLLGRGRTLQGRLLAYDALEMTFREYRVRRDPRCAVCGENPSIQQPQDLAWACSATMLQSEARP